MESHFEINVAVGGKHYFATAPRSFTDMTERGLTEVRSVANYLRLSLSGEFPTDEVVVSITRWEAAGTRIPLYGGKL